MALLLVRRHACVSLNTIKKASLPARRNRHAAGALQRGPAHQAGARHPCARSDHLRAKASLVTAVKTRRTKPPFEDRQERGKSDVYWQPIAGLSRRESGPSPRCGVVSPLSPCPITSPSEGRCRRDEEVLDAQGIVGVDGGQPEERSRGTRDHPRPPSSLLNDDDGSRKRGVRSCLSIKIFGQRKTQTRFQC